MLLRYAEGVKLIQYRLIHIADTADTSVHPYLLSSHMRQTYDWITSYRRLKNTVVTGTLGAIKRMKNIKLNFIKLKTKSGKNIGMQYVNDQIRD